MQQPQPLAQPFTTVMHQIESGLVKIPQFQRGFVWDRHKSAKLLDSLLKGYPIGTFIFWRTREELRSLRNLGDIKLPDTPKGEYINYVLDGQQRLTTLFATVRGLKVQRDGREDDFSQMYIDLSVDGNSDVPLVITDPGERDKDSYITVGKLLSGQFAMLAKYPAQFHAKMQQYKSSLR